MCVLLSHHPHKLLFDACPQPAASVGDSNCLPLHRSLRFNHSWQLPPPTHPTCSSLLLPASGFASFVNSSGLPLGGFRRFHGCHSPSPFQLQMARFRTTQEKNTITTNCKRTQNRLKWRKIEITSETTTTNTLLIDHAQTMTSLHLFKKRYILSENQEQNLQKEP